ncbi:MAG: putative Holliday junction resolvase [Limisphaerales bacterium]|jgi:putative Holliday junction resolvase
MAFDYGKKRTGVAVTDPLRIIATGLTTVETPLIFKWLKEYLLTEKVGHFVVGYPLNLDNSPTHNTEPVEVFIRGLKKRWPNIPISKSDERFTSKEAMQTLIASGVKKMARRDKKLIDEVSATLILQDYLRSH